MELTREAIRSACRQGHSATCVLLAERWLRYHPNDLVVVHDYATMLYSLMRYDDAIRVYLDAIERFPDDRWGLYNQLGRLHDHRGDLPSAECWYRKAIDEDPDESASFIFLASTQAQQGKLVLAEDTLRRAVQRADWRLDEAYHKLGMVLRGQGRLAEAAECFRKAADLDPEWAAPVELLGDVEQALPLLNDSDADPYSATAP